MERLPFDPSRMTQARAASSRRVPASPANERPLTVSQLADLIGASLREGLPPTVRVVGEVSGFRERTHWYFDLKDAEAVVNCVVFAGAAARVGFLPANGQEVVATGRVELYAKQGKVSLLVSKLQPVGAGALELAYRRLCEELRALGWFDHERKRPVPPFPRRVAVVTSRTGAALQDVLDTMRRRCCAVELALLDVRVQGEYAAPEITQAVRWLGRRGRDLGIDAILITRGGGSMEDLWAFNDRALAEAIVRSPIPVVAAIGHETDTTIAELVADLRCATPTQAAVRLTPDNDALREQLDAAAAGLRGSVVRLLREGDLRLRRAARHPLIADPQRLLRAPRERLGRAARDAHRVQSARLSRDLRRLERLSGRLDALRPQAVHARSIARVNELRLRLDAAIRYRTACFDVDELARKLARAGAVARTRRATVLDALSRQLDAVGPLGVLKRGFSYTQTADGVLVRSVEDVRPGDTVRTTVADGRFDSIVGGADVGSDGHAAPPPPAKTASLRSRTRPRTADSDGAALARASAQMDLFGGGR